VLLSDRFASAVGKRLCDIASQRSQFSVTRCTVWPDDVST